MMAFWSKKNNKVDATGSTELTWSDEAKQAIEQSLAQAPVPAMLKGQVRKQLTSAAEEAARAAGHSRVTPEDVMSGMLAKMPANVRSQVEQAMRSGNLDDLKNLPKKLRGKS